MFFSNCSTFYAPASAKHPQTNRGSPFTEGFPSFAQHPLPPGPKRNLAVGNLDPHRAAGTPVRVYAVNLLPCLFAIYLALHFSCTSPFSHFTFSCTSPFYILLFLSFTFLLFPFDRSCTSSFCTPPFLSFTSYFLHLTVSVHDSLARHLLFCNVYQICSNISNFFDGIYSASDRWNHFSAENCSHIFFSKKVRRGSPFFSNLPPQYQLAGPFRWFSVSRLHAGLCSADCFSSFRLPKVV